LTEPGPHRVALRRLTSLPVRAAVTLGLLALLAVIVDWSQLGRQLERGDPWWLAAAVVVLFLGLLTGAWRWHALLAVAELSPRPWRTLRAYFMGAFTNNFLPTGFGGDAVRTLAVGRSGPALARGATTVLVDRLTALGCLIAISWLALALHPEAVPASLSVTLLAVSAGAAIGTAFLLAAARSPRVRSLVPGPARPAALEILAALRLLRADRRSAAGVMLLGLAYQALVVLSVWCGARAVGLELAFALVAVTLPLVLLATLVPISVAGFGIREGGYVVLLAQAGVAAGAATVFSLVTVVTMALASMPGALAIMTRGGRPQPSVGGQ
jgi:glycosyltransferase 2 family protein